jgi:pimeloyl-ACP methyl ester carboxylesterase
MGADKASGGAGGTVVLIHGMWSRPHVWQNFRAFLEARGYRVVTPTLRHHDIAPGEAADPALGETSLLDYAADLEREIKSLGTRPFIIGHSMGGLLAQMLAQRGLARGAVLLGSTHCAPILSLSPGVVRIFLGEALRAPFWRSAQLPDYGAMRRGVLNGLEEQQARDLYATLVPESGRPLFEIAFWYFDRRRAAFVDAERMGCPLLFLTGSDDRTTPAYSARRTADYYGHMARFELLRGHAHWLPAENGWERVAERTLRFFEKEVSAFETEAKAAEVAPDRLDPLFA